MRFGVTTGTTRTKSNQKILWIKNLTIIIIALPGELGRRQTEPARGEQVTGCLPPPGRAAEKEVPPHVTPSQPWTSPDEISVGKLPNRVLNALLF